MAVHPLKAFFGGGSRAAGRARRAEKLGIHTQVDVNFLLSCNGYAAFEALIRGDGKTFAGCWRKNLVGILHGRTMNWPQAVGLQCKRRLLSSTRVRLPDSDISVLAGDSLSTNHRFELNEPFYWLLVAAISA